MAPVHAAGRTVIGLISDTHGLLRPEAVAALAGVDLLLHAGDIGTPGVLHALRALAPVVAVRGNTDGEWARSMAAAEVTEVGAVAIYLVHDLHDLASEPGARGYRVVISGHTHRPMVDTRAGVLFVNPGSAGPRRFRLPVTAGRLTVAGGAVEAAILTLIA